MKFTDTLNLMRGEILDALEQDFRILFVDECLFSAKVAQRLAYSSSKNNIVISEKMMTATPLALLAAVSVEGGLETSMIFEKSVNSQRFIEFLDKIAMMHQGTKIAILMDNLSVHHSKVVKTHMRELGFKAIFNVPYSPQYNPIELVFGLIKHRFKKLRLEKVSQNEKFIFREGIL